MRHLDALLVEREEEQGRGWNRRIEIWNSDRDELIDHLYTYFPVSRANIVASLIIGVEERERERKRQRQREIGDREKCNAISNVVFLRPSLSCGRTKVGNSAARPKNALLYVIV